MRQIVAATRNRAKLAELARLVDGLAEVTPLPAGIGAPPDAEPGATFEAIATNKAVAVSREFTTGVLVAATDGGLVIPALPAWDPLRTRRFAGDATGDRARADALLALTSRLEGDERRILWREALAVARDGVMVASWVAESPPGLLARDYDPWLIGEGGGFWVPALWVCPEHAGRRLAKLTPAERGDREDHWARLGVKLRRFLADLPAEG